MKTERHLAQAQAQGGKCSYMRAAVGFLFWVFQGHFSTISLWQVLAQWFLGLTFPDWKGSIGSLSPDALWVRSIEWLQISQTAHPQCCPSRWRAWPGKTLQHEDNRICTDLACRQEALIPWLSAAALGCQVEAKRTQQLNEWPRAHFTPGRTQATVNTADWAGRWGGRDGAAEKQGDYSLQNILYFFEFWYSTNVSPIQNIILKNAEAVKRTCHNIWNKHVTHRN